MKLAETPLVSIVIPMYNQRHDFFAACVKSALSQTYPNIEVIISNNHSTNGIERELANFRDERVKVFIPDTYLPMVDNFAFAASKANGEFISFLSSDDWLYPDFLETIMPYMLKHPECVFGYGEIESVDYQDLDKIQFYFRKNAKPTGVMSPKQSFLEHISLKTSGFFTGDIIRKDAYEKAGGIKVGNTAYSADFALGFKLHEFGGVVYVNKPFGKMRRWTHKEGKSDAIRLAHEVTDKHKSYSIVEESPVLLSYLEGGTREVKKWRRHYANIYAKGTAFGFASGYIPEHEFKNSFNAIKQLYNGFYVRVMQLLTIPPFHQVLSFIWKMKRSLRKKDKKDLVANA